MAFNKREYADGETLITAKNLNDIQDKIIELDGGLFAVEAGKSGVAITITDAATRGFRSLNIYGKTTQDGAPSLETPAEIVNVGKNGSMTVDVTSVGKAQSMTIPTPNGLPGIPVTSGGNYTDADGQQWICDELDFTRGVHVKRIAQKVFNGNSGEAWNNYIFPSYEGYSITANDMKTGTRGNGFCDKLPVHQTAVEAELGLWLGVGNNAIYAHNAKSIAPDVAGWRSWLAENPITVYYVLAKPVETALPEEELAAYASLHTYRDNTTVSNDAGAYMELEYVMDSKKYIDSLALGTVHTATVE